MTNQHQLCRLQALFSPYQSVIVPCSASSRWQKEFLTLSPQRSPPVGLLFLHHGFGIVNFTCNAMQCNVYLNFLFLEAEYKVAIVLVVIRLPTATIAISTACQASSSWLSPSHYQRLNDLGEKVNKEMTFSPFLVSFTSSQRQFLANFSAVFFLSRYKQLLHSLCRMISSRDFEINDDRVSQVG